MYQTFVKPQQGFFVMLLSVSVNKISQKTFSESTSFCLELSLCLTQGRNY